MGKLEIGFLLMKTSLEIFQEVQSKSYALGAFNFCNAEILRGIVEAVAELKTPVIVSTSQGEGAFLGFKRARALADTWQEQLGLNLILHLDHGKSLDIVKTAIDAGYDSIHFDGSGLSFEENVKITQQVVEYAKQKNNIMVEGELGYLRGASAPGQKVIIKKEDLTDPVMAVKFIQETRVDSLAVAIGNIHGIAQGGQDPHLDLARLSEIQRAVSDSAFLVLHGGSGIPDEDVKQAIKSGIVKINVNTELRVAYANTLRNFLLDNSQETTPYKIMESVVTAVKQVVTNKLKIFCE